VQGSGRGLISDIINVFARRVCGNPQKYQSGKLVCGQRLQQGKSLVKLGSITGSTKLPGQWYSSSSSTNKTITITDDDNKSKDRSANGALTINIAHPVDTSPTHLPTVTPVSCQSHRHCGRKHRFLIQFPTASRCAPHFLSRCSCRIGALVARRCSVGIGWRVSTSRLLLRVGSWPQVPATDTQQVQLQADAISQSSVVTAVHICECLLALQRNQTAATQRDSHDRPSITAFLHFLSNTKFRSYLRLTMTKNKSVDAV